jgi:Double-GTPase 2
VCPYCFARIPRRNLRFRCPGRVVGRPGGCEPTNDDVHASFRGVPTFIAAPVFAGDGRATRATHAECGQLSLRRVCPSCHSELPSDYCDVPSRLVALVGAKNSGKSTYIAVLLHELLNRVGRELNASLNACDDRTAARYHAEFEQRLYEQRLLPRVTQTAAQGLHDPLVYRLTVSRPGLVGRRRESLALVLFDSAGEDLTNESSVDSHLRYLGVADAIIFLVDPLELRGAAPAIRTDVAARLRATAEEFPGAPAPDRPLEVLRRVTDMVRTSRGVAAPKRLPIPVAVGITKIDSLDLGISQQSRLLADRRRNGKLDLTDRGLVGEEMRALLTRWGADSLERELEASYEAHAMFGLSALGHPPANGTVAGAGITPRRVEDPLLWLLNRFHMIPADKG